MAHGDWPEIVVFGTTWCGDCRRTTQLLDSHEVPYRYHDVDAENLSELVIKLNEDGGFGPRRRVPTVLIDRDILSEPSDAELAQRLGLE